MELWMAWSTWVQTLRPACARTATFEWMRVILAGLCIRADHAGVTSVVRALALQPRTYLRLLHLFHSEALHLPTLTACWVRFCLDRFSPYQVGDAIVCLADGIKIPKEGKKMPAVKKLHQESTNNSKPEFIHGHSFQALSLLVRTVGGSVTSIPLTARIHEGVIDSQRELRKTLLDRLMELFFELVQPLTRRVILVADTYYASAKVIRPLLEQGHHLVTRVRSNAVAYRTPPTPRPRRRGRPRRYGEKVQLKDLLLDPDAPFTTAPSPVYDEKNVEIAYFTEDLLWRPVGHLVRFVFVHHPRRGNLILLTSDTTLDPLDVITLYGYRFKIEVGFRQAIQVMGSYFYHFWMRAMTPRKRASGRQDIRRRPKKYQQLVRRKIDAYHRFVQLGCIAQGLLQLLAIQHRPSVWKRFRSWLRTMHPEQPPSELVVAQALRTSLPEFLADTTDTNDLAKFLARIRSPDILQAYERAA
ncbi:MAG: transposase [Thermoanaerobaculia bacterium]